MMLPLLLLLLVRLGGFVREDYVVGIVVSQVLFPGSVLELPGGQAVVLAVVVVRVRVCQHFYQTLWGSNGYYIRITCIHCRAVLHRTPRREC